MGCICSKGVTHKEATEEYEKGNESGKTTSVQVVAPSSQKRENFLVEVNGFDGSVRPLSRTTSRANNSGSVHRKTKEDENKTMVIERPSSVHHQRWATMDMGSNGGKRQISRIFSVVNGVVNGNVATVEDPNEAAGWPSWLTSVAGDAIKGWVPRKAESFEKLDKVIGSSNLWLVYLLGWS